MVFAELKKLFFDKQYRLFMVLVLWLLIGFSIFQFKDIIPMWVGYVIFLPLLVICAILFIISLIFRADLKELTFKRIVIYCLIAFVIIIIFIYIAAVLFLFIFVIALISYVLITATFYMYSCYDFSVDLDEKVKNIEGSGGKILRWVIFLGLSLISIIFMIIIINLGVLFSKTAGDVQFSFDRMAVAFLIIMIILLVIGILSLIAGKLNAWLGLFFLLCCIYYLYLMVSAYFTLTSSGGTYSLGLRMAIFAFDVLLIVYTTAILIGKKTEVLSEKFKFVKPDGILMWLIFSKAAYEFAKVGMENINISAFNAITGIILFTVLFVIAGLYGIVSYSFREKKSKKSEDEIKSD